MSANKTAGLHPAVKERLERMRLAAFERGIEFVVTNALRTEAQQLALFAQGRNPIAEVNRLRKEAGLSPVSEEENKRPVTATLTSTHLFGLAFDVAIITHPTLTPPTPPLSRPPLDKGGMRGVTKGGSNRRGVTWDLKADLNKNQIPDYEELGNLGESLGLTWGGRFKLRDYCHFEYTGGLAMTELKAGKRPPA